ncbi:L-lactate permease [Hoylesella loescheii]|uniref:L-lactate permease n=1 Tax=Hoylesella loescheii TaxID=840 RepID=UPI0028EA3F6E|nr:L-lactate permease [Hoylesella loescheii]
MAALVSVLPIVLLFVLMLGFKMAGHRSAFVSLLATAAIAVFLAPAMNFAPEGFTQSGVAWAFVEGALKAVFPILIIILMALFSYNVLVESKQIEVIKAQFTSFSDDDGVTVLVLVWGFGGLLEGMAGFGTAVAIPAAILISLGYKPLFSALVSLIANTVPTGFGAVGVPVITLANEIAPGGAASQELISQLSVYAVMQLSLLYLVLPFIILTLTNRSRGAILKNLRLALWVGAVSLGSQYLVARYLGAETPAIIGSLSAIVAIVIYAKLFAPRKKAENEKAYTASQTLKAWAVYAFILLFILLSGPLFPPINAFLKSTLVSRIALPIHAPGTAFSFAWIGNAGLMLFLGTVLGGLVQGLSPRQLLVSLARTVVNLRKTTVTIISLVALAAIMNYAGMILVIADTLANITGKAYPLFAPLIGAIGTFVTGSDTSSNILFAKLQANVATQLHHADPNWIVASNTTGATGGKMISPQSIAIATAACDMQGQDGEILKSALPYAALYIIIGGLMVMFAG